MGGVGRHSSAGQDSARCPVAPLSKEQWDHGSSLAVQWLGLRAFTAVARVQSLVRELRSRKPHSTARKVKKYNSGTGHIRQEDTYGRGLEWLQN